MVFRLSLTRGCLAALFIILTCSLAAGATSTPCDSQKAEVNDGHVYHDLGRLWNNVTNFGLIGSYPEAGLPFSGAPSARWPGQDGPDQLWGAGLWIGATVLGEHRVTTGIYQFEMRATDAPADTIYATSLMAPGGARYPSPLADDDHDGLEDEDPLNGLDDDGDGLVDEDFAAISDQEFRCVYSDTAAAIQTAIPDHQPLGISVTERSFQWDAPYARDFIGYEFTIRNVGDLELTDVYAGIFADFDMGAEPGAGFDDLAGYRGLADGPVPAMDGTPVPVQLGYMHDAGGYAGFVFCLSPVPAGCGDPCTPAVHRFKVMDGLNSYPAGGDPTNDAERYESLSTPGIDPDTVLPSDYRILLVPPVVPHLAPGEEVTVRMALVAAADLDGLVQAAANAVRVSIGEFYDRDGDPANGREFQVPWLTPEDVAVPSVSGHLAAAVEDGRTVLTIATTWNDVRDLALVRRANGDLPARRWNGSVWTPLGRTAEGFRYSVVDGDLGARRRSYDLVLRNPGRDDLVLDTSSSAGAPGLAESLQTGPNPFNATLDVDFSTARDGRVTLEVFDFRGRRVRTLFDEDHPPGSGNATWDGRDQAGVPQPSGIYLVRMVTVEGVLTSRVAMVK